MAKLSFPESRIFSELWAILCPDGQNGVEKALPATARGSSGCGGAMPPGRGSVLPPRSPLPNAGPAHYQLYFGFPTNFTIASNDAAHETLEGVPVSTVRFLQAGTARLAI